jgi:aminopeptidase N
MQTNLANWYPFVVPFVNGQWILHDPWWYGDYLEYPVAGYQVNLVFVGEVTAPVVAASGGAERIVDINRYTLENGRAFAFSISPNFEVSNMKIGETTISSYFLPAFRKPAEAAMEVSAQSIELFSEKFGEYPYSSYSIVQAGLSDSREFSGLSFISRGYYQSYNDSLDNFLAYASIHSAAHQWWFNQVGNDPAMEPWLDESLATYSELLYFENLHPDMLSYWQENRVDFFRPQGKIDASIYESANYDAYKQAVYFNGAKFLGDLRERIGDDVFFEFLQDYYDQNKGQTATGKGFFRVLGEHTDADYSNVVNKYFKNK